LGRKGDVGFLVIFEGNRPSSKGCWRLEKKETAGLSILREKEKKLFPGLLGRKKKRGSARRVGIVTEKRMDGRTERGRPAPIAEPIVRRRGKEKERKKKRIVHLPQEGEPSKRSAPYSGKPSF